MQARSGSGSGSVQTTHYPRGHSPRGKIVAISRGGRITTLDAGPITNNVNIVAGRRERPRREDGVDALELDEIIPSLPDGRGSAARSTSSRELGSLGSVVRPCITPLPAEPNPDPPAGAADGVEDVHGIGVALCNS
jgi:hypothetical protein